MLMRDSAASSVRVVGIVVGFRGATVRFEVGSMRIRHAGRKSNWSGVELGWLFFLRIGAEGGATRLCSGDRPHPNRVSRNDNTNRDSNSVG